MHTIKTQASFSKESFLKVLESTQGAWGPASPAEIKRERKQRKLELKATRLGKEAW